MVHLQLLVLKNIARLAVADLGGGCIPPTNLKLTISAEKLVSISVKTFFFFFFWRPPDFGRKKRSNFRKISLNFGEDLFFFLFLFLFLETTGFWAEKTFEFPISAEKSVSISVKTSEFLRF